MVSKFEADVEEQAFTFQYAREGKDPRWIRVYSPHVSYIDTKYNNLIIIIIINSIYTWSDVLRELKKN